MKPWERYSSGPWTRFKGVSPSDDGVAPFALPEEEPAPRFAQERGLGVPEPVAAPVVSRADVTDDARAERGFGRSAYLDDGMTPNLPTNTPVRDEVPNATDPARTSSVSRRDGRTGLDQSGQVESTQPISDLGKRTARGATEVIASVPEALGVMQSSGVEGRIDDTRGGLGVRQEQIDSITARLSDPTISDSERRMREQQLADLQEGQQAIAGRMETLQERASVPTQERPIFQLGDQIRSGSTEFFGAPDPQYDDRFASKLAEGGGSLLGFAGVTALTGWIGGGLTGAAVNSAQLYNEAIEYGATEDEARTAAAIGAAIGTTEVIPIGRALDRFAGKAKSRISGALARRLVSAAETAGEEGIQEAATQIANNLTAAGIYDENREWSEGALEAATIGAILGGGLGALTPGPATPPRSRDPEDRERMDSPRLTPSDRASPIPNDIIDDGKKAVDELLSGATPVAPLDEAAPNVRVPEADVVRRPLPTDRLSPTMGAAPQPDTAPRSLSEPLEDSQNPGRFVQIDFDTGQIVDAETPQAAAVPPVTPEPAAPAQPQSRRLSEPMERTDAPGQTVQVDLDTGETVPTQQRSTDAQTAPEPATEAPAADVAVPEVVDPTPAVQVAQPRRPAPERLKRRPLTDLLKAEGVQPGSSLATELAARGIDQRTTPGLFKAGGRTEWDNLPVSEWSEFAPIIGDDGNGYLSRDGLIEAVENELRGQPVQVGEQARLQEARDLRNYMAEFDPEDMPPIDLSDIPEATITIPALEEDISTDAERRQMVERSLGGVLQQTGLTEVLTASERAEITNALTSNGGNVEDMLWSVIRRSADSAEDPEFTGSQADAAPQDGGSEAETAVQQSAGRPERDRGAEGRGDTRQDDVGRDNGRAAEVDPREEFAQAKAEFDRLDADRKIEDAEAYFSASRRLSAARRGLADKLAEEGGRIELANSMGNGATITPTGDGYQISYFDNRGFSGDTRHDTLQAAVRDAVGQGYDTEAPGLLKQKQQGEQWQSPAETERVRQEIERPATERTDAGEQTLMPGVAPITERDRQRAEIERRQNSNLRGRDEGPGSGRGDLFGAPEDRRDLFDAPQSNVDQEVSPNESNAVEVEPQVSAQPDQETPADLGRSAASAGNDRKPPADMSSEDMAAWLNAYDAEVSRMIEASKAESRDKGGKVIEGQPKVKVTEYKPAPDAPTLQEPQTAKPMNDRARELARLAKVADKLEEVGRRAIEKANEDINAPRQENTARRARMAGNAVADATVRLRNGETAVQIAEAMRAGEADALESVRSIKDIERIDAELKSAQYERLRNAGERVSNAGPPTEADLANVKAPSLLVRQGEIQNLLNDTKGKRGVDRRVLNGLLGRNLDGFIRIKGRDVDAIEAAVKAAKQAGPLSYGIKQLSEDITKFRALERMVGDDPQGFYGKYLEVRSGATVQTDPLKAVRRSLIGNKIPGFFETPEALAQRMIEEAGISQGDRVLEPSGGLGRIATKLAEAAGKENVTVLEINPTLNSALRDQGFNVVGSDFMEYEGQGFDAIVMNPPFEKRQDAEHVMRAHGKLKPGGRLVAIMGEGVFFGSDAKAVEFRNWLDDLGGTSEKLPEGTFKESGTGVNTRLIVVDRAEVKSESAPANRLFKDNLEGASVSGLGGLDVTRAPTEKIQDFGEKIGGARKDTATSTGPRGSRSSNDGQPGWRKRYAVIQNWDLKAGQADKDKWMILDKRTNKGVRDGYRTKLFDTEAEAEAAVPLYEVARNHKVYSNGDGGFAIHRLVSDRKRPVVKGGFETREEAMQYMAENPVEIIEFKTRIDDTIHPALEEAIRVGEERRAGGRDVVAEDFGDIFGFRGVEFGEWNNGAERQHILNQAYDALLDMAEIIRVSPRALSLNGEIGLAFGARGQGLSSARAHYEMDHAVINLTKIKGAGSLAHEWWHAVDHYLARIDGKASSERLEKTAKDKDGNEYTYWTFDAKGAKEDFASWGFLYKSGMREEMRDAIKGVMDAISKRKMEYTEDQSTREKIAKRRSGDIDKLLEQWRAGLATEQRYGRKTAPATDEQLKRFDAAADRIRKGDMGEMVNAPSKGRYSFRFYEPILEIAEINKEVRGRQSYGVQQNRLTGDAVRLQNAVDVRAQDQKFLEDAKAEKVKTKTVRSEFYSNAWALDQGRVQDYWSTNHELSARAFEAFVYDRLKDIDARNDFLAYEKHNDLPEYRMFNAKPYPEGQERADINAAFEKLFDVIETKTADDGAVMMYQRPLDMFYSPLLKAVNSAKQKQAPAKDWKAIVAKLPGVKKAEMEWLGVEDWLDTQEGQVPREALVAFIRDSQIELVEDRLGERPESFAADFDALRDDESAEDWTDGEVEEQVLSDAEMAGTYTPPNFETYTEDGGENYREVLVRVPNLHKTGKNRGSTDEITAEINDIRASVDSIYKLSDADQLRLTMLEGKRDRARKFPFVQSAHFEQENIVVHARVKDRTGPNGERVLFVEEIQSDLASVWRENSEAPEVTARRRELSALRYRLRDAIGDKSDELAERIKPLHKEPGLTVGNISEDINSVTANLDRQYSNWKQYTLDLLRKNEPDAMNELAALHREAESVQAELLALGTEKRMPEGTPDTPFKEEHTYNLMVKRLLRMAAEEGYDQLSWTPGYMQAERWNSAAQSVVEGIEWDSAEIPGYRYVNIQMASGGQSFSVSVEPSGRIEGSTNRELEGKQLSSLVGPGLAKQIMTEQSGRADNQKITFPDSGYAIAYDQQTKRAVDKLVKKHGTQVRVDKSLPDFEQGLGALINEAAKMPKAEILSRFDSLIADIMSRTDQTMTEGRRRAQQETLDRRRQNLVRALDADEVSYGLQAFTDNDLKTLFPEFAQSLSSPVWSVTITPELREAAMQPMAMFRQPTAQDAATVEAAMPDLAKRLKKVLLDRVKLVIAEGADFQGAFEARGEDLRILIGATRDGMKTLNHEVIHALRNLNLFTDKEWSALSEQAQAEWLDKYDIPNRYDDLDAEGQIEEAIAEAFADFVAEQTEPGPIKAAFAKMRRMFRAVREWLSGNPSVQGVFEAVDTGRVGRRGVPSALRSMIERGEAFLFQKGEKSGKGIRAYHGSPHNFDRFSMDAIGTGEGAQAYGHGLYFAENEAVARGYRDRLTAQNANAAQRSLAYRNGDVAAAIEDAKRKIAIYSEKVKEPNAPDLAHRLLQINKQKLADLEAGAQPPGKMYEVRINANPDDFLDWDAPLSEQRGKAKAALDDFLQWYAGPDGRQEIYEAGIELGDVQNQFDDLSPSQFASAMRARGVPGSKYRDAGSRGRPGGLGSDETRNYVVFDENLIEVVRKYQKAINTTTAAFKRWFGDSKVVDGNGDPLVVYRGMSRDMENGAFRVSEGGTFGDGIYLTSDPEYANIFAGGEGGQVFPVYASIQNPAPQSLVETVEANATAQRRSSRAILEDMGYDGMIAEDGEIVAFRPEQIKSVYNRGTFNPNDARIMYQRQPSARQKVQETLDQMPRDVAVPNRAVFDELFTRNRGVFKNIGQAKGAIGDRVDVAREFMQDRILPLRRAQETIERETGQPISEAMNAYVKEETYHGKVGRRLDDIQQFTIEPIRDLIAESADLDTAKVNDYLTALHAEERNARIAKINPNMPDGGSGMTNAEAQKILKDAKMSKDYPALKEIARLIGDLRDRTLQLRVDAGLMTAKDAELLKSMYKNYVSLKGFEEFDGSEALSDRPNIGRGYSVKGPETKRALGRKSRSFDVLANMLTQAQEVAIRAEKNRVGKAVFDLASQYPSDKLWRVREVETKRVFNKQTGLVETRSQAPTARALADNEMAVKIDGKEYRIEFLDPRLARAMGAVKSGQMGTLMQWLSLPARYFSAVNTMIDPEFVIRNAFRDMQAAQINIRNFGEGDRNAIAKGMIKNWPKAFKAAYQGQKGKTDTEWTKWYREFEEAGAKVSFWKMEDAENMKADLDRQIALRRGNKLVRAGKVMMSPSAFFSTRDNAVLGFIERSNLAVDNAVRLAAYVEARKAGWSKQKAASLSKNLTVNFNRRGHYGPIMNALYPFYNAGMQGTQVLFRAMSNPKRMSKYIVGMIGIGVISDFINAAISDEDDDGVLAYDKLQKHKQEMSFVISTGDDVLTVPMPYGYNVFPYMGTLIGQVMRGVKDPDEAIVDFADAAVSAFSPIYESDGMRTILPMVMDLPYDLATNTDWLHRPIRPENPYGDYGPDAYKFYGGASEWAKGLADVANRATGGTIAEPGMIDISPEYMDHIWGFAAGGAGRFVSNTGDLAAKIISGNTDEIEGYRIPFARQAFSETGHFLDRDRYYRFRDRVNEAKEAREVAQEAGEPLSKLAFDLSKLESEVKLADKVLRAVRKERAAVGPDATAEQRKEWEARESKAILRFNQKYVDIAGASIE